MTDREFDQALQLADKTTKQYFLQMLTEFQGVKKDIHWMQFILGSLVLAVAAGLISGRLMVH